MPKRGSWQVISSKNNGATCFSCSLSTSHALLRLSKLGCIQSTGFTLGLHTDHAYLLHRIYGSWIVNHLNLNVTHFERYLEKFGEHTINNYMIKCDQKRPKYALLDSWSVCLFQISHSVFPKLARTFKNHWHCKTSSVWLCKHHTYHQRALVCLAEGLMQQNISSAACHDVNSKTSADMPVFF